MEGRPRFVRACNPRPAMCDLDPSVVPLTFERPCPTLDRMLRLGRVRPEQAVAVAGPAGPAVQLGLLRKRFVRVVSACGACGGEDGTCDALLLTGPCADEGLAALAERTARLLSQRGVVVAHEASPDGDVGLARGLAAHGLLCDWVVHDMAGPCLVAMGVHRAARTAPVLAQAA